MARRKWNELTIDAELRPVVVELGRFPTRSELTGRGQGALWDAMRRHGGIAVWRDRAAALRAAAPASEQDIRTRAYFLALEGAPGGPVDHWLAAERELQAA